MTPIVLSLSPGDTPLSRGAHVAEHSNMWRACDDFWDKWEPLHGFFGRLTMNANDYSRTWYSCDEVDGDFDLKHFNGVWRVGPLVMTQTDYGARSPGLL